MHKYTFFSNYPENPDTVTGRTLIIFIVYISSWMDFKLSPCTQGFWSNRPVIDAKVLHGFGRLVAGK